MLTNEQKALIQIVDYIKQEEWKRLEFYCQIVNPKHLQDPLNQKIFNALKYLNLEGPFSRSLNRKKTRQFIISELLTYLQKHYPQENITANHLIFLDTDASSIDNTHLLVNLKHTYTQTQLYQQFLTILRPSSLEGYPPHLVDSHIKEIFAKLKEFILLIPNESDKDRFTLKQSISSNPEFLSPDVSAKQTIQEEYYRLSDNFEMLNKNTKGFKKGQVITIGGYTGLGKTTFVYNLLLDLAQTRIKESKEQPHMVVFSYEMTWKENLIRLLAHHTQIPLNVILDKDFDPQATDITPSIYIERMESANRLFTHLNLTFNYDKSKSINYIVNLLYRLHLEKKVDIVVIDYIQIIKSTKHLENDRLAIDEIMKKIKELATKLEIIIILSQFYRDIYSNYQGESPEITTLKGSGGIETNSDIVLIMSEFNPKTSKDKEKLISSNNETVSQLYKDARGKDNQKIIEVNIEKNRSGSKQTLVYHFDMETQTFKEVGFVVPRQIDTN
ncbi:replicative DNA helicase [Candidatus Phytoplasma australiense]|uniref:replicative DNA helicase n=1 Tax=Phytoplasma australiense TaxID=59748 RepID=UPI00039D1B39|nr:DnaB-like helicase C-terminal domain-containing protein [Candidatus Phytoplasma australiense]